MQSTQPDDDAQMAGIPALVLICLLLATPALDAQIISTIDVRGNTRTRSDVIRRELLFAAGDSLDAAVIDETERNLRRLLYLGRVTIITEPAQAGSVNVVVEVGDLYARALSPLFSGDIEEVSYGGVAVDFNLFGLGQTARITAFDDARSGRRVTTQYGDPRLGGTRLRLATEAGWAEEGHTIGLSLSQPFYSLAAPWAFGLSASSHGSRTRLYSSGRLAALYEDRFDAASGWLVRSYGGDVKIRPGIQLSLSDRTFSARSPFIYQPGNRRRVTPSLVLTVWQPRYSTARFIRYLGPQEDFQTGSWLTLRAGLSSSALGSDRDYPFASVSVSPRFQLEGGWYLFSSFVARSRWANGGYESLLTSSSATLYGRLLDWPYQPALAARLDFDTLSRPEDLGSQYLLGGNSGLRGYLPRRFDGRRRLTANVELRPLIVHRPDWALGAALFADAGGAWDDDPRLYSSVGAGLRLGLPRIYDTPVLRADVAHGLGAGVWQLSFGLGQYF